MEDSREEDKAKSEITHWDKSMTRDLVFQVGLTYKQAGLVVGIIAEHRQIADREGYKRGYDNGFHDALKR